MDNLKEKLRKKLKDNTYTTANKLLDDLFGKDGTESREQFNTEAYQYYYGVILKERRKELKMTQKQLAEKIGKKRPYISRVENGQDINLSSLIVITNALELSFDFKPISK